MTEIIDVTDGLWVWRSRHPDWVPAMRELLALPSEHVIVSHGAPVHDRPAFERALTLAPYQEA